MAQVTVILYRYPCSYSQQSKGAEQVLSYRLYISALQKVLLHWNQWHQQWNDIVVPIPETIANQTPRLRWVQPNVGYSCWAIDNVNISVVCLDCMAPPLKSLFDYFASSLETERQWQTPFESGMVVTNICGRSNRVLQFSTVGRQSYAITRLPMLSGTAFIQFNVVINCNGASVGPQHIRVEYSTDSSSWNLAQEECLLPKDCEDYTLGSVYPSDNSTTWRRVLLLLPHSKW